MKDYKLKTTRPEFLLGIMTGGNVFDLTFEVMNRELRDNNELNYVVYTVLMEADIDIDKDVTNMNSDGESLAITFRSKSIAKKVKEKCNKSLVRYGNNIYQTSMKVRDQYLIVECSLLEDDDDEELEM